MEKIKKLLADEKIREIITYLIFGVLTTAVNWIVYLLLTRLLSLDSRENGSGAYVLISNIGQVAGWVASVLFAYFTNKKYVFQSGSTRENGAWKEFWLFVSARVASLLIFDLLLFNVLLLLGMNDKWDKLLMNVLVIIFNYAASKFVIFRKAKKRDDQTR